MSVRMNMSLTHHQKTKQITVVNPNYAIEKGLHEMLHNNNGVKQSDFLRRL